VVEDARQPVVTRVRPQPLLDERAEHVPGVGELVWPDRDLGKGRCDGSAVLTYNAMSGFLTFIKTHVLIAAACENAIGFRFPVS
jgi:hypothetical protein